MQRRNKRGGLIFAVLAILAVLIGWREFNRKIKPVKNIRPAFQVSAAQIIKEFESNDSLLTGKYSGKLIAITGPVKQVDKDNQGFFTVVVGESATMSSVRCAMDSLFSTEVNALQKGQTTTIKGMLTGFQKDETGLLGSDIILNRCVIELQEDNQ